MCNGGLKETGEHARLWCVPEFGGAEVLHVCYRAHRFERHAHEQFATSIIDQGAGAFRYRGERRVAPAGSLVALDAEQEHTGEVVSGEGWSYRILYPSAEVLGRVAAEVGGSTYGGFRFPEPVIRDLPLAAAMDRLHRSLEDPTALVLERESLFLFAYGRLLSRHAARRVEPREAGRESLAVRRAREYLEGCYASNVSLEDLSVVSGLSRFHLIRVFKEAVGLPPHAYLTGVRLRRAKELLAAGVPVGEVAMRVGFADQSHLTRRFKGAFGITPGRFAAHFAARPA
jgi:AraC-like DNA-binding protein